MSSDSQTGPNLQLPSDSQIGQMGSNPQIQPGLHTSSDLQNLKPAPGFNIGEQFRARRDPDKKPELKVRLEEANVRANCDQSVAYLEVATWVINCKPSGTVTKGVTTAGFNEVRVWLNDENFNTYYLQADKTMDVKLIKRRQTYQFEGPSKSGVVELLDPDGRIVARFSQ
ncbi:hypothetical protein TWF481_001131 [Arthrobotrys musiformis]|uniref:Uncharacterized protein n=1 Tax=Arthrobotrys musiformis TaxID=47236 RepID=A0AAV9WRX5_9PEZI